LRIGNQEQGRKETAVRAYCKRKELKRHMSMIVEGARMKLENRITEKRRRKSSSWEKAQPIEIISLQRAIKAR